MKKYLFIALAALGFAACADKLEDTKSPAHNGETEESYIAINLMAADADTRAEDGGLDYGTAAERKINTAYFFFFDENGNPFNVVNVSAPGGNKNYLPLDITTITSNEGEPVDNVSDISNAVLILDTYKGIYPSQIVAVLNWVPTANTYSLDELHAFTTAVADSVNGGYVMSNSVYMDGAGKMVDAVAITGENIKTSADAAKQSPIEIYVERIAAKVVLTAEGMNAEGNIFSTQKTSDLFVSPGQMESTPVYVQLLGWELYNEYNTSNLVKNINTAWSEDVLGLMWNDRVNYRCYWASSQNGEHDDNFYWQYNEANKLANGFTTEYGFAVAPSAQDVNTAHYTYCGENTNGTNADLRTKVILKGQLLKKNGENYEELEIASWYGNEYAGEDKLLIAVANSLAYTLFSSTDQQTYSPIQPSDLICDTAVVGTKSYETGFKLSAAGEEKTWYKYSSDGNHQPFDLSDTAENIAKTNAYLAAEVKPAIIYAEGMTYYIVDIEHLGRDGKEAQYGVVRNHVYQININSIKGYGSPVYSGFDFIVENPEYPEVFQDSYVAARINVLSWKVVKQQVDIVQ